MSHPSGLLQISYLVRDYDQAIAYFTGMLGFNLLEDLDLGGGKRWVRVAPQGGDLGSALLLAKAASAEQEACIGRQAGGRVFLFLRSADFWSDYRRMLRAGVRFLELPRLEPYGNVVVFTDLNDQKWDLIG